MSSREAGKMSVVTVSMLIVVTTFGFANVIDNLAELGLAAIPSWILVGFLYFLPLALILAEFASDTNGAGGIYSYMERGLGPTWAFVGTWSYFVANLVYLQSAFSKLPIRMSLAVSGGDVFEEATVVLPLLAVVLCAATTFLATRGVRIFSHVSDWVGKGTLVLVGLLIFGTLGALAFGRLTSATPFTRAALTPSFDLQYFSTFSWLLFAVAGAEVAAPYVRETRNPRRDFPRAILASTLLIGVVYILATVAVAVLLAPDTLTKATGMYDLWVPLAELLGLPGPPVAHACMTFLVVGLIGAYVVWMESPIRAMFAEVPAGTFPDALTRRDEEGTHHQALRLQALVVGALILLPLLSILTGTQGSEKFISLLNDMSSLSLVVPYVFIALAYVQARRHGMQAPFQAFRSTPLAVGMGVLVLVVSALGYLGAGLFALTEPPIDWTYVAVVYGGPILLILLGLVLRFVSLRAHPARGGP